ncbi:unnamed protein product, partial [marine sediment metagenome]
NPLHPMNQMGHTLQEEFVIIRIHIGTLGDAFETPAIDLARETFEFGNLNERSGRKERKLRDE